MTAEQARQKMILRMLHMDDDGDDEEETEKTEETNPVSEGKGGANTRLPYGLCKRFGIHLPDRATPREAWDALKGNGVSPQGAFAYLKEHGSMEGYEPENTASGEGANGNTDKPKAPEFKPAKTIQEAEEYARKTFGVEKCVYDGLDIEVANTYNEILTSTISKAPKLVGTFKVLGNSEKLNEDYKTDSFPTYLDILTRLNAGYLQSHRYSQKAKAEVRKAALKHAVAAELGPTDLACYTYTTNDFDPSLTSEEQSKLNQINAKYEGLFINPSCNNSKASLETILAYNEKIGYHPQGCSTIKSVVDHELGHALDKAYGLSKNKDILAYFEELTACKPNAKGAITVPGATRKMNFNRIKDGLSGYAADPKKKKRKRTKGEFLAEFIAEAWAEYCNNEHPREIAAKVGKIIEGVISNDGTGIY